MSNEIIILSILGFIISVYAFYVEQKQKRVQNYKAACDIHERVSCTKAFASKYGKIAGVPNSLLGIFSYLILIALSFYNQTNFVLAAASVSLMFSLVLAYISYAKMKNFCLVCTVIYIINLLIFILAILANAKY